MTHPDDANLPAHVLAAAEAQPCAFCEHSRAPGDGGFITADGQATMYCDHFKIWAWAWRPPYQDVPCSAWEEWVDTSDIPEATEEWFTRAKRHGPHVS
jgi:hypothetical protein